MKTYEVYENNAGGISLFVYDDSNENVEYLHTGYEYSHGQLSEDIKCLENGDDPVMQWDGNEVSQYKQSDLLSGSNFGILIADNDGVYPGSMGSAGKIEFGILD